MYYIYYTDEQINKMWYVYVYIYICLSFVCHLCQKCLLKPFAHFLIRLFDFFCCWFVSVAYAFWIYVPYQICKYFLPFPTLSFHSLECVLCSRNIFRFDVVRFVYFYFCCLPVPLVTYPGNHYHSLMLAWCLFSAMQKYLETMIHS